MQDLRDISVRVYKFVSLSGYFDYVRDSKRLRKHAGGGSGDVGDIIWDKIVGTFIHEAQFLKVSSICKGVPPTFFI